MSPPHDLPTRVEYVRDLMGVPSPDSFDATGASPEQKRDFAQYIIYRDLMDFNAYGCAFGRTMEKRVRKAETWLVAIAGGSTALLGLIGVGVGVVKILEYFN